MEFFYPAAAVLSGGVCGMVLCEIFDRITRKRGW